MESLKIADQKTMEEFFKTNLNLFPQAKELLSLQIFRHDPSMIINPTVVIAKYQLRLLLKNGQTTTLILRGSADTVGYKRLKSYHILQALWGSGFGEGINIVPRPLGYFSDLRLLLYENVNGRSLIDAFKHPAEIYLKKIEAAIDWLADFHQKKTKNIPEAIFNWQQEQDEFNRLLKQLTTKYAPQAEEITRVVELLLQREKTLLRPETFSLIHGDYQPNNIIFTQAQTAVIDFNDALLYDELFDLAYFLTQAKFMLKNLHNTDITDFLETQKQIYFQLRGLSLDDLSQKKIALFTAQTLLHIQILTTHGLAAYLLKEIQSNVQKSI
ncbi:MAG: aminoglycoside phosphotransferase family protein [Patescibacteria group bacterium]